MFFKQFLKAARFILERLSQHGSAELAGRAPPPKQLGYSAACMISRDNLPR